MAVQTTFLLLAHEKDHEIVVGTLVAAPPDMRPPYERTPQWYQALSEPGYAKAVMSFLVEPAGTGSLVTTETRVFATDDSTRRRFAIYWRVIYPGSALIRRMWLRAIQRRAESLPGRESAHAGIRGGFNLEEPQAHSERVTCLDVGSRVVRQ